jgi:hypothetical protein
VEYAFEAVGLKKTAEQTFECLRPGGTATIIGMVPFGMKIELHAYDFLRERKIQGSSMGSDDASDLQNGMAFKVENRKAVETSPEERERIYEAAWERGGLQFRAVFQDMLISKEANDTAADFIKRKIRSIVKDAKTAAILSDIDHPYAAKRPPIDTDYFGAYNRPNVSLVDVKAAPIRRISRGGICNGLNRRCCFTTPQMP